MMSLQRSPSRETLIRGVEVILRVPSLFIAEVWSRTDPETVHAKWIMVFSKNNKFVEESNLRQMVILTQIFYYSILGFIMSLILLPLQKLVHLYTIAISAALLLAANYLSGRFVTEEISQYSTSYVAERFTTQTVQHVVSYLMLQYIIASAVMYLQGFQQHSWTRPVLLVYSLPLLARILGAPAAELQMVHHASATFMLLLSTLFLFNQLSVALEVVRNGVQYTVSCIHFYGWLEFVMAAWIQMLLPLQFLVFWLVLFSAQLYEYVDAQDHPIWNEGWAIVLLASMSESCSSPLSFLGACVTVAYLSRAVLRIVDACLGSCVRDPSLSGVPQGFVEGVTMFILGIQTGLVELKSADRIFLLSVVLFIVLSSLIQSIFEITDPVLLWLAASQNKNISKHISAVALSTFLWIFPISMTVWICRLFDLDFWLLVIVSSCILTSVQVLGALFVYALLIFDSLCHSPSEQLDDIIYYIKCLTRILEFFVAVFVVCYGVERSLLGNWNWLNSSILVVHCYFNVWHRLQSGWNSYLQRRDAIKQLKLMREATLSELREHDDLCAICYQEMLTARITPCRHFFHNVCLKKWLFIQDYCPICHEKILDILTKDQHENNTETQASQQPSSRTEENNSSEMGIHSFSSDLITTLDTTLLNTALETEGHVSDTLLHQLQDPLPEKVQQTRIFVPVSITACLTTSTTNFQKQTSETKTHGSLPL